MTATSAIDWPESKPDTTLISRHILLEIVEQLNELTALKTGLGLTDEPR